jgi:transcriptional regulator with XRE-family HTH domain
VDTNVANKGEKSTGAFRVRFIKLRGNLSQAKFAKKVGLSRPAIGHYESGKRVPDINTLINIAVEFGVSTDWLLGLSEIKKGTADDSAVEKRLGLNEGAISTLERLKSKEKSLKDAYTLVPKTGKDWENVREEPSIKSLYKDSNNILRMLNLLLSTQRNSNNFSEVSHAEFILHTLHKYFYDDFQDDFDRTLNIACIHADIIEFERTIKANEKA